VIVDKTGGEQEQEAFAFLGEHVRRVGLARQQGRQGTSS
jgi:hypothetical protein